MIKFFSKTLIFLVMFLFITLSTSWADYIADITYDYTDHKDGSYTFDFTVHNNSTGAETEGLDFFIINFDADSQLENYSSINFISANGWFNLSGNFDGDPGYVLADDSIFGGDGIPQGDSLGGFTVNFDYSGSLLPTEQIFFWEVGFGYEYYGEGFTRYNPVPEPATLVLFGLGLLGLAGVSRKK